MATDIEAEFSPSEAYAEQLDAADPLADLRDRFYIPDGELYMDGNSLGLLSKDAEATLDRVIEEWKELGIRGWTDAEIPWFWYAEQLGDQLAPLVGAAESEVVVSNSTTVNIHTLIGTFYEPETAPKILVNELDFPTDHYAIRAQMRNRGVDPDENLVVVESQDGRTIEEADVVDALETHDDIGLVFLPSVFYRSGQLLDIGRLTDAAHDNGALIGFDLAHTVGVVPHDLSANDVDFAVWCHYKYLNAGPGAIAGLYVNERHFGTEPALPGWWGHKKDTQFEMNMTYTPAETAGAWQIGTIPMLSAAPLEGALEVVEDAGIDAIREKSRRQTEYLMELVDHRLADSPYEFRIGTPRDPERRGGHVAIERDADAYPISQALKDRGVVVDFRPPNVIRICPSPLYTRYQDIWQVSEHLQAIIEEGEHEAYRSDSDGVT
ncbi:MAG: kynureninase [Halobacteriales archaeon]